VLERRDGRHVYYHLRHQDLAEMVVECTKFVLPDDKESKRIISAIDLAKTTWAAAKTEIKSIKRK
jgi:hypothetical protein